MNKKILIVDDSMFMRNIIKNTLIKNDYTQILEASCPEEAIKIFKKEKPDIVTMDVVMETSGVDCVKDLKAIDNNAKVIMCSAMGQQPYILESIKNGASDFIVKPFKGDNIIKAIKHAIG